MKSIPKVAALVSVVLVALVGIVFYRYLSKAMFLKESVCGQ